MRRHARQSGQVLVLFALLLPALLAALGLAVEVTYSLAERQRMQVAADSGALNGSYCLVFPSKTYCQSAANFPGAGGNAAKGMAASIAVANGFDASMIAVQSPYNGDPNRMLVTVTKQVPTTLLRLVGFNQFSLSARAVGAAVSGVSPAAILALDPTQCGALSMSGNASIDASIGIIQVNSNCTTAATLSGNASIAASETRIVGNYTASGSAHFTPNPTTGVAPLADPLASLAVPSITPTYGAASCGSNQTLTLSPGVYPSITASANCAITLQPGAYAIKGGGVSVSGNASITGNGVLIYNGGTNYPSSGGTFGAISLSGNGTFNLKAQSSGTYAGLLIFQERASTRTLTLSGNAAIAGIQGTVYGPSMALSVSGNGTMPAQFVIDSATISGNGSLTVHYDPTTVYGVPSMSLVE